MKISIPFTVFILLGPFFTLSQNLIPNPSFERYYQCPIYFSEIYEAIGWDAPPGHLGTPDYFNRCATVKSNVSVPNNAAGYEDAATGNGYVGILLFVSHDSVVKTHLYREYIEAKLIQPLTAGVAYKVSLKYSLGDSSYFTTNAFGVVLKDKSITGQYNDLTIHEVPQWAVASNLGVTNGWTVLEFNYTATGGERFIALGNFNSDSNTRLNKNLHLKSRPPYDSAYYAYIYLDDISVSCISPPPSFSLGKDTLLCQGATLALHTSLLNQVYQWQDGSSGLAYTVTQPGTYWLKVADPQTACFYTDTIHIRYKPIPVTTLGLNLSLCEGQTMILNPMVQADNYLWQDGSVDSIYTVTRQGTYSVIMKKNGCNRKATAKVNYNPLPVLNLGHDTLVYDTEVILNAGNIRNTYLWQDGTTGPVYTVTHDGIYWVKAVTDKGCVQSDTVIVKLSDATFDLPNVFTPNNDRINDTFIPAKMVGIQSLCIHIYNRWGEKVYTSCDLNFSWNADGFPEGVYFWELHYTFGKNKENSKSGWLQILR